MNKQSDATHYLTSIYKSFCKGEIVIAAILFITIVFLSFLSAVTRKIGAPLQWAMDVTQLCFAWLAFLSGDIALRGGALPGFDMLIKKMPARIQRIAGYACKVLIFALLVFFIYFGFKLSFSNMNRTFHALPVKYMWVSLSLPCCSILMIFSTISNIITDVQQQKKEER
ncbi:MAG: TRAP transporter small permease [Sphaerochaetaceae bacterium]